VPGRIQDDDVVAVRDRAKIDEIVGSYVTLKRAGSSLTGLCPFHEERSPSFNVTPVRGLYYCFGCGEGGDVINFVQKVENLSFTEAVERLADKVGIQLRYTDERGPWTEPGLRVRLVEAYQIAADFYAGRLAGGEALPGRRFLHARGFDRESAEHFGVGWAPRGGRELGILLQQKGFRRDELVKGGLIRENGGYDFFQGRLLWPIRDPGKSVIGFGARRILDDDRMPAKYINTPETVLYKKSMVLYGIDLARQQIARKAQAVVVEGYTDVMACHLSGVDTAVASCGTAFGNDHARLLRRLMGDHVALHGEVIFTFDGDKAGQDAAIKVFAIDQTFTSQTYVAVEPTGLDPCDLRLEHGEARVRELVARRVPLYQFVMGNALKGFDLDRVDGRLSALRAAAPLVASVRDSGLVAGYVHELAKMIGTDPDEVRREVMKAASRSRVPAEPDRVATEPAATRDDQLDLESMVRAVKDKIPFPDPRDRSLAVERETAKLIVQVPRLFTAGWQTLSEGDFTHPGYAGVFTAAAAVFGDFAAGQQGDWAQFLRDRAEEKVVQQLVAALAVEPLLINREADQNYVVQNAAKLQLIRIVREITSLKSKLQRTNPVDNTGPYNQMFSTLLGLEARRKELTNRGLSAEG